LANCLDLTIQFTSFEDIWKIADLNWSSQCKISVIAVIINLINTIWYVRNQARFNNNKISWHAAISLIISSTSLTGNNTKKVASNSIRDFIVLKHFKISIHNPRTPIVKEIFWNPPLPNWIKCNIDGASKGNPGISSCGGIFRNNEADFFTLFCGASWLHFFISG
jgi:hypothetical protein